MSDYRFLQERHVPDLIIIDVFKQEEDGERLCRQLKNNEQSRGIPLLFLSNHRSKKQAFNLTHATDVLFKPFRLSDLFCMVQKYTSTGWSRFRIHKLPKIDISEKPRPIYFSKETAWEASIAGEDKEQRLRLNSVSELASHSSTEGMLSNVENGSIWSTCRQASITATYGVASSTPCLRQKAPPAEWVCVPGA